MGLVFFFPCSFYIFIHSSHLLSIYSVPVPYEPWEHISEQNRGLPPSRNLHPCGEGRQEKTSTHMLLQTALSAINEKTGREDKELGIVL